MGENKLNVVGTLGKASIHKKSDSKEKVKYLDRKILDFRGKGQGSNQDSQKSRRGNQGWNYYRDSYRQKSREPDCDWIRKRDYKDKNGLYVPLRNHNSESRSSRMEAFRAKLMKGLEIQESCLHEIKADISILN